MFYERVLYPTIYFFVKRHFSFISHCTFSWYLGVSQKQHFVLLYF